MLRKPKKVILTLLVILILASSTFAFAAANTITWSNAGFRASDISGYKITNVAYDLALADPTLVIKITFNIATIDANGLQPVVVKISTDRVAEQVADLLSNPPVLGIPADVADWSKWACVVSGASSPWLVTCSSIPGSGLPLQAIYSLDVVASSSADAAP